MLKMETTRGCTLRRAATVEMMVCLIDSVTACIAQTASVRKPHLHERFTRHRTPRLTDGSMSRARMIETARTSARRKVRQLSMVTWEQRQGDVRHKGSPLAEGVIWNVREASTELKPAHERALMVVVLLTSNTAVGSLALEQLGEAYASTEVFCVSASFEPASAATVTIA